MRNKRAVLLGSLTAATLAALVTCDACSTPGGVIDSGRSNDTSGETAPDASQDRGVIPDDVSLPDADPGWRYLTELPGCDAEVPIDPQVSMKKLAWIACPSGRAECQRFDTSGWREDMGPAVISTASVSLDKRWVTWVRPLSGGQSAEWDLYDRMSLSPVNAWVWNGACTVRPVLGASRVTLFGQMFTVSPPKVAYANGPIPSTALTPTFLTFQPQPKVQWVGVSASDVKIAFEDNWGAGIDMVNAGDTTYVSAAGKKWFDPLVVGADVFAWNEYGVTGWSRELRVNAAGSSTVFREVQGRHVSHFKTDGSTWFWVEAYGDANPQNLDQPLAEVWSAPFTNDPTTLASNARKLAQVDGASTFNGTEVALDGYFAVGASAGPYVWVVRGMDGAVKKLDIATLHGPGPMGVPQVGMQQPAFVSKDEVWGILAGTGGSPQNLGFAKFQLGSWP